MAADNQNTVRLPTFNRKFFTSAEDITVIGSGSIGGKAQGLAAVQKILRERFRPEEFPGFEVKVPRMTVIASDVFGKFIQRNHLRPAELAAYSDQYIAHLFQRGEFPAEHLGDLLALMQEVHSPLAVRSSSLLEDALAHPFAGVYATKMIPNHRMEPENRFQKLLEAIKFVYASTYFREARAYIQSVGESIEEERMAVIIQEIVGGRMRDLFYPTISGVGRTYNYYPIGKAKPMDGVVNLALGLGKTIVDGGITWAYSPAFPRLNPPYNSINDLLKNSQTKFWAVNMGLIRMFDPLKETEYMTEEPISIADEDGNLKFTASTYNPASDRLYPGVGAAGPRMINFAPVLVNRTPPLNDLIKNLLEIAKAASGAEVEIEFAVNLDRQDGLPAKVGFLQMRQMAAFSDSIDLEAENTAQNNPLVISNSVMGNGKITHIIDIVYVKPETFQAKFNPVIAEEIDNFNCSLVREGKSYLLLGFGRWGSSDPWLGIPVVWSQICGAGAIVESTLPEMNVELSQGSHFFHNLTSFKVPYFTVRHTDRETKIDWQWLNRQKVVAETKFVRQIALESPLTILVDGRVGKGVIFLENSRQLSAASRQ